MKRWMWTITETNRQYLAGVILEALRTAPVGFVLVIQEAGRTLMQNAKLWPMLTDISTQVLWDGERMTKEEWKDWFTAALRQQRQVRGMEPGTIVFVGCSTSLMGKKEFSDLIELMYMFGANNNVQWSDASHKHFEQLRRTA
jgi:hypothetical protein